MAKPVKNSENVKKSCSILFLHVLLTITLRLFHSEVGNNTLLYHFSGELVSALTEIHINCDLKTLQKSQTPLVGPSISQHLFVHACSSKFTLFPRLYDFLDFPRRQRKARKLACRKRHAARAKSTYGTQVWSNEGLSWGRLMKSPFHHF